MDAPLDLFAHVRVREAAETAAAAREAWHAAQLRYWRAPKGERQTREKEMQAAARTAMAADLALLAAQREAGR